MRLTSGRIVKVDTKRYTIDALAGDGVYYRNVQIPFIAGVDGVYGLTLVPKVGQRCLLLNTEFGFVALPIFVLGNSLDGYNPEKELEGATKHLGRKPEATEGELLLSLPETVLDVLPNGKLCLYLGDFEDSLTSLEMDRALTKLRTGSFMLVNAGGVFEHSFDEEAGQAKARYHFRQFQSGGTRVTVELDDSVKLECGRDESVALSAELKRDNLLVSAPGIELNATRDETSLKLKLANIESKKLSVQVDDCDVSAKNLRLSLPNLTITLENGVFHVQTSGGTLRLTPDGIEIQSNQISLVAREVETIGSLTVRGDLRVRQNVEVNGAIDADGRITSGKELVATVPKVQSALNDISTAFAEFVSAYLTHAHPAAQPVTGIPIGVTPRIPLAQIR